MKKVILFIGLLATAPGIPAQEVPLSEQIRQLGESYERAGFHGVVLLARNTKVLGSAAFGVADQDTGRKNTLQTRFRTESTGKLFTATAIMQLVEAGKLELQQTVAHYLPASGIPEAENMSLHHLLTHQSGLTAPWEKPGFEFREYGKEEWWNLITTNTRAFEKPGTGVYYSSSGYEVLAAIIEQVSGKSFEDYCRDHIFLPAGMQHTSYRMDTLEVAKSGAKPYRWTGMNHYRQYPLRTFSAGGAGGWFSSVSDFHKFAVALQDSRLLNQESLKLMTHPHVSLGGGSYGYGIQIMTDRMLAGKTVYGHNGGGMGYGADLFMEPESGILVATMSNMYGNSTQISANFMRLVAGQEPERPVMDKGRLLFDLLESGGLEDFSRHHQTYFEAVGMEQPDTRTLIMLGDTYAFLDRQADRKRYFEILGSLMPDDCVVWMFLGDLALESQDIPLARARYEKAHRLAEKADPYWIPRLKEKLSAL